MREPHSSDPTELRRRAELKLGEQQKESSAVADQDLRRLVAELQVHQVELEIQNEELQQARADVEAGLKRYTDLYDFAPVSYFTMDRDGTIVQANFTGAGFLGVERSRLMQRRLIEFFSDESRPVFNAFLKHVFVSGAKTACELVLAAERAGQLVHVRVEAVAVEDGHSCRAVMLDITDRKQAEVLRAARQRDEQARIAAEMANAAKDRFLAVLSHELRTPLTPVLAAASMLQKHPHLPPQLRETLEMIRRNVELEARLIDDLLDITLVSRGKVKLEKGLVDLYSCIHLAVEVCLPDIEGRRLNLDVEMAAEPCPVEADAARLQQVIWNLLRNAVKFTPSGGSVNVRCRPEQGQAVLEVSDSGIGIKPQAIGRIFDVFDRGEDSTSSQYGGLGLGLSISRSLVEMHGGTIDAHSDGENQGATFTVRLPLASVSAPDPSASERHEEHAGERSSEGGLHLLLVEDHGDTAEMLDLFLSSSGHQVQRAGDVATALEMLSGNSFDLLISDLGLPDRSGIDLMRELRARGSKLPGIALSGYGQERDVEETLNAGFAAHVLKPVDIDRLLEVVTQVTSVHAQR